MIGVHETLLWFDACRVPRGDGDVRDTRQTVHRRDFQRRLRPRQRTVSHRGPQRRRRLSVHVRPHQQHGGRLRRRTAGQLSLFYTIILFSIHLSRGDA